MPSLTLNPSARRFRQTVPTPSVPSTGMCPGHVVEMVVDAALRFLVAAEATFAVNPTAAVANVRKAQRILVELMAALDRAVAPEITDTLLRLYQTIFDTLGEAAAREDVTRITGARLLLTGLRDAWAGAARSACRPAPTPQPSRRPLPKRPCPAV